MTRSCFHIMNFCHITFDSGVLLIKNSLLLLFLARNSMFLVGGVLSGHQILSYSIDFSEFRLESSLSISPGILPQTHTSLSCKKNGNNLQSFFIALKLSTNRV